MDTLNTRTFPPRHFPKNFLRAALAEKKKALIYIMNDSFNHFQYTAIHLYGVLNATSEKVCSHSRESTCLHLKLPRIPVWCDILYFRNQVSAAYTQSDPPQQPWTIRPTDYTYPAAFISAQNYIVRNSIPITD